MTNPSKNKLEEAKRLMGALVRQPPKLHDEMKVGKPKSEQVAEAQPKKRGRPPKKQQENR